jgi:leucyl-tRNA synthetase
MELTNIISDKGADKPTMEKLCLLIAPFAPHLAEEVWVEILGNPFSVHRVRWPEFDDSLIDNDILTIIVQINGKVRGQLEVNALQSIEKEKIEKIAREDTKITKWLEGEDIKKVVFVPGKIINFVI